MSYPETLSGTVEKILFENSEGDFTVARIRADGNRDLITAVGPFAVKPGESLKFLGRWVEDRRFGRQFSVESFESILPVTEEGIRKYLGSGMIHGIGPTYANRIVDRFGTHSIDILDKSPERLREVEGIGQVRLERIKKAWIEQRETKNVVLFLQEHGVSTAHALRIFRNYGDQSLRILRENPYRLASEVYGMGFRTADAIAGRLGIPHDSVGRAAEGVAYHLLELSQQGHVCFPREDLLRGAAAMLGISVEGAEAGLATLLMQGRVSLHDGHVYLAHLARAEVEVAEGLVGLLAPPESPVELNDRLALEWVQARSGLVLGESQKKAILMALRERLLVITGNPGCGKSTLVRSIAGFFANRGMRVELAAPTGRAARRLSDLCGQPARTIHRLLEFRQGRFTRNEANPIEADLVVVDETSMMDLVLLSHLLKALASGTRVIFVGDTDQLPSVGPGTVLREMIESGPVPCVALTDIFRQAESSMIIMNAHRINRGQSPVFDHPESDCFFLEEDDPEKLGQLVVSLVTQRLPGHYGLDPLRDIQILCPMRRGSAGVIELNRLLQQALNPDGASVTKGAAHFRVGDKVMQMVNNYDRDVYNGDIGMIEALDLQENIIRIRFDTRLVEYEPEDLDEIALAYACSVHKSQGSEFHAVVVVLHTQHYIMLQRNLIYTALTRARRLAVFVGSRKALAIGVRNDKVSIRHSHLAERIRAGLASGPSTPSRVL